MGCDGLPTNAWLLTIAGEPRSLRASLLQKGFTPAQIHLVESREDCHMDESHAIKLILGQAGGNEEAPNICLTGGPEYRMQSVIQEYLQALGGRDPKLVRLTSRQEAGHWSFANQTWATINIVEGTPTNYLELVGSADCIFVEGGNVFRIIYALRSKGLEPIVKERCKRGALYVGRSAGAVIAGAQIVTADWKGWDPRNVVPEDFSIHTRQRGLNLIPGFSVFAHYQKGLHRQLVNERSPFLYGSNRLICLRENPGNGEDCENTDRFEEKDWLKSLRLSSLTASSSSSSS